MDKLVKNKYILISGLLSFIIITSILGLNFTSSAIIDDNKVNKVLDDYVKEKNSNNKNEPYGKAFSKYTILGQKQYGNKITKYIWIFSQEYYVEKNSLKPGLGELYPAIITIKKTKNNYIVMNYKCSKDIEENDSISIFPSEIKNLVQSNDFRTKNNSIDELEKEAEIYFNVKSD